MRRADALDCAERIREKLEIPPGDRCAVRRRRVENDGRRGSRWGVDVTVMGDVHALDTPEACTEFLDAQRTCDQCHVDFVDGRGATEHGSERSGVQLSERFCSESCAEQYDQQMFPRAEDEG